MCHLVLPELISILLYRGRKERRQQAGQPQVEEAHLYPPAGVGVHLHLLQLVAVMM